MAGTQNYINHIALVLDASSSMETLADTVVKVADNQITHLAQRSKELDQETRVTVYTFSDPHNIQCLFYDKDVLRLPSLRGLYKANGWTALIDATLQALDDLAKTPELYGDHAFLTYVLTDGAENRSRRTVATLAARLKALPDHWTTAVFVPNADGMFEAKKFGFAPGNISLWDTTSKGLEQAGESIRAVTDSYMRARSTGVRGSRSLFTLDMSNLQTSAVQNLPKRTAGQFRIFSVQDKVAIAPYVERQTGRPYQLGEAYYQLTKRETVGAQKNIALLDRNAFCVYVGREARQLLGLPDYEVKVTPANHPKYDIFVQSTSVNRWLLPGTSLLLPGV